MYYTIGNNEELNEFNLGLQEKSIELLSFDSANKFKIKMHDEISTVECNPRLLTEINFNLNEIDQLIYGKNPTKKIVNISYKENNIHIFTEDDNITETILPYNHWSLSHLPSVGSERLKGNTHFKYIRYYSDEEDYKSHKKDIYQYKLFNIKNVPEAFMTLHGFTYFKDMTPTDVSVLSFDIETSGINPQANDAKVFLITNTLRKGNILSRKTFNLKDYNDDDKTMIADWCSWVRDVNPSILLGHNIIMFDLPYLESRSIDGLLLGRDNTVMTTEPYTRELRKDGSQSYSYSRKTIFGREIIDTFFLAIKFDVGRKYTSYALKVIIREEGKEKPGRTFIDASKIKDYFYDKDTSMWELTLKYGEEDSDDALTLYDLMGSVSFYMCNAIPKPFQLIIESASGSQLNSLLVRAYIQNNESIPKPDDVSEYQGAISFAIPGIYKNCKKIDYSALYPSIMMQYELYNKLKDPHAYFAKIVKYFADNRQVYKKLYMETGDKKYDYLQNFAKTIANSCYGFLASVGLNFNSPKDAAFITEKGRELLKQSIIWATGKDVNFWLDVFNKKTGKEKYTND